MRCSSPRLQGSVACLKNSLLWNEIPYTSPFGETSGPNLLSFVLMTVQRRCLSKLFYGAATVQRRCRSESLEADSERLSRACRLLIAAGAPPICCYSNVPVPKRFACSCSKGIVAAALPGSRIERTRGRAGTLLLLIACIGGGCADRGKVTRRGRDAAEESLDDARRCSVPPLGAACSRPQSRSASGRLPAHQRRTISCLFCGS